MAVQQTRHVQRSCSGGKTTGASRASSMDQLMGMEQLMEMEKVMAMDQLMGMDHLINQLMESQTRTPEHKVGKDSPSQLYPHSVHPLQNTDPAALPLHNSSFPPRRAHPPVPVCRLSLPSSAAALALL